MLNLSAPEMTALVGGLRVLGSNVDDETHGVFTNRVGQLTQRLLREPRGHGHRSGRRSARTRTSSRGATAATGELRWTATRVDLVFGANSVLRAIAEEFAAKGGEQLMLDAFVRGWVKVMENDRFDLD